MIYRRLGRTNLTISALGFGAGGPTFLGQSNGMTQRDVDALIDHVLRAGINYFDVSPSFVAEHGDAEIILGRALGRVPRHRYLLSGKTPFVDPSTHVLLSPGQVARSIENSLQRLGVDYLDVFYIGGYLPGGGYEPVIENVFPVLRRFQQQGKIRFIGGGEKSSVDGGHEWLAHGLRRNLFEVVMVAFNLINQSAEHSVFPLCREQDVGVITIYTVRRVFNNPRRLREIVAELKRAGMVAPDAVPDDDPFGWLIESTGETLISAAYKWGAAHPAVSAVMTGTLKASHLDENVRFIEAPYLPPTATERLRNIFGRVTAAVGN